MMHGNAKIGAHWFKDCFTRKDRTFEENFEFLAKPYGRAEGATLVYLILGIGRYSQISKIVSDEPADLLETIPEQWHSGRQALWR